MNYAQKLDHYRNRNDSLMAMYRDGATRKEIARAFGISYERVSQILRQELWKEKRAHMRSLRPEDV